MGLTIKSKRHGGILLTLTAVFALVAQPMYGFVAAQVANAVDNNIRINEFSSKTPEWIELYNPSDSAVVMTDWYVEDMAGNKRMINATIASHGFWTLDISSSILNDGGDNTFYLKDAAGEPLDTVAYPGDVAVPTVTSQFAARTTDGASTWELRSTDSKGATNNPIVPTPQAILSSTLGTTAQMGQTVDFTSTITKQAGSSTPNIRVKTTLADPSQASHIVYQYQEQDGTYHDMPFVDGSYYYGESAGFPLHTASGNLKIKFTSEGSYTSTAQIIDANTADAIGDPVTTTVVVTDAKVAQPVVPSANGTVIYNSIPQPFVSSLPSQGYAATSTSALGDKISFAGSNRKLVNAQVVLNSWACEQGTWQDGNCTTTPGATFTHPITLNVYKVATDGSVGDLLTSKTQTFAIPYRPSVNPSCPVNTDVHKVTAWKDINGKCNNGYNHVVTFDMTGVTVPDSVIYSVAYNTSHHGASPLGVTGPYDALNFSFNNIDSAPSTGNDVQADVAYWDTTWPGYTAGLKADSGWTGYMPAVKFTAESPDTTAPNFMIANPANGAHVAGTVTIDATVTDESDITKLLMNIGGVSRSWTNGVSSTITRSGDIFSTVIDTKTLPDGPVYTVLRGTDGAGNTRYWNNNAANRQHVMTVDNTAPTVKVNLNRDSYIASGDIIGKLQNAEIEARDTNLDRIELWKNGVKTGHVWTTNATKRLAGISFLGEGNYEIKAYDKAGNVSDEFTFVVDNTAPEITVKDDFVGSESDKLFSQVSFKLYDAKMADKYVLNGHTVDFTNNKWSDANFANIKSKLVQGLNTFVLYDTAGNSASYEFTYDSIAPQVTAMQQKYETKENGRVAVTLTFDEVVSGLGQGWYEVAGSNGTQFIKRYYSTKAYDVSFADRAGNAGSYGFIVDATPATSTHNLGDAVRGTISITQVVDDNTAPASGKLRIWKLDADGAPDNTKFFAIGDVDVDTDGEVVYTLNTKSDLYGDGVYRAKFTATDVVGNASVTQKDFIVDNSSPVVIASLSASTVKSLDELTLTLDARDTYSNIATAKYTLYDNATGDVVDGHKNVPIEVTSPAKDAMLTTTIPVPAVSGSYRIQLHVNDALGNQGKKTVSFTVDNSMTVTIDTGRSTIATPTISGVAQWNVGDNAPATGQPVTVQIIQDGVTLHTLTPQPTSATGAWQVKAPALTNGKYDVIATVGTTSAGGTTPLTPLTVAVPAPVDESSGSSNLDDDSGDGNPLTLPTQRALATSPLATNFSIFATATPAIATATDTANQDAEVRGLSTSSTSESSDDEDGEVKAAEDSKPTWSFANTLLAAAAVVMGLMALLGLFGKREEGEESRNGRRIIAVVLGAGSIVALLSLENFAGSMSFVDLWSLGFAALVAVQIAIIASLKRA